MEINRREAVIQTEHYKDCKSRSCFNCTVHISVTDENLPLSSSITFDNLLISATNNSIKVVLITRRYLKTIEDDSLYM